MSRLFADMVAAVPSSVDLLESRTHDSFATIQPKGAGFTWVPVPIGLGIILKAPPPDLIYRETDSSKNSHPDPPGNAGLARVAQR